jgi:hypothetical protein
MNDIAVGHVLDVGFSLLADEFLHCRETTRCAKTGLMHRSEHHRYSNTLVCPQQEGLRYSQPVILCWPGYSSPMARA